MQIVKNYETNSFSLMDGETKLLETGVLGAEFVLFIYTNEPIVLTEDDELYNSINDLFNNNYIFDEHRISKKEQDTIVWLSDVTCDFENPFSLFSVKNIPRLVIQKKGNTIEISCTIPFFEKMGKKKDMYTIAFSPSGNGYYSKNLETGMSFQDDFILTCRKVLDNKTLKMKKTI